MTSDSKAAFTAAIQPHFERLYRLAYRFTGARADAEDLLQDVLTKLYERRGELSSIRDLSPWLGRVVYNQFVDNARRYRRKPLQLVGDVDADVAVDASAIEDGDEPLLGAERHEQREALEKALVRLSEEHRLVLLMHDAEGYKISEIQEVTGLASGTVKSRLHRARARLRELLSDSAKSSSAESAEKTHESGEPFPAVRRVGRWTE